PGRSRLPNWSSRINLRATLDNDRLPAAVRAAFAALCARRTAWYQHTAAGLTGPVSPPAPGSFATDPAGLDLAVGDLLERAASHASRHEDPASRATKMEAGRSKEAAWLLARLTELL